MKLRLLILGGTLFAACLSAQATDWYYVGASNDWWNAASYSTTTSPSGNTTMPGPGDVIYPQSGQKLYMDDTTVAFLNTVDGFYFPHDFNKPEASFYLNLTTNATLTCAFGEIGGHNNNRSWLIKDGPGILYVDGRNGLKPSEGVFGNTSYRYSISFDVRAGDIHLEPKRSDVYRTYYGGVKVAEGAALYTGSGTGQQVLFYGVLEGAGVISSDNTEAAYDVVFCGDHLNAAVTPPTEFSGYLTGQISVNFRHSTYLTGTSNDVYSVYGSTYTEGSENQGVVGIKTWAGAYAGNSLSTRNGSMCLLFLNDADETVCFPSGIYFKDAGTLAFDAGARGGVSVASANWWGLSNDGDSQGRLILTGSNTMSSVFYGPMVNDNRTKWHPSFFIKKQGTGTWRFDPDTKISGMQYNGIAAIHGVFAVDEGTLEVPSLAEAGMRCSLGYSDQLFEDKIAPTNELAKVPYAIRLGTPTTGEGTLSYVGTAGKTIATRPIGVQGKGRLKAPNAPYLCWENVQGLASAGENVMTFEVAAGQTNTVTDLSGNLSVVKDGPGDLTVKGDLAMTGDWVAKEGTVTFVNATAQPYSWFKLTVKETAASSTHTAYSGPEFTPTIANNWTGRYHRRFDIEEFGLYDASGTRVNDYQTTCPGNTDVPSWAEETLQPGQIVASPAGLVSPFDNGFYFQALYALDKVTYYDGKGYRSCSYHWKDYQKLIRLDQPDTWISVVHRLKTEDVGKIASWDVCQVYSNRWTVTALEVSGSADGVHWDSLFATNNIGVLANDRLINERHWVSGSNAVGGENAENKSHPKFALPRTTASYAYTVNNPRAVSVAKGATLTLEGAAVTVNKLVIAAEGAGTLKGAFAFAAGGTLEVPDLPNDARVEIAGTYDGCTGMDNLSTWSVTTGGKAVRRAVSFADGKFVITKYGLTVIVR